MYCAVFCCCVVVAWCGTCTSACKRKMQSAGGEWTRWRTPMKPQPTANLLAKESTATQVWSGRPETSTAKKRASRMGGQYAAGRQDWTVGLVWCSGSGTGTVVEQVRGGKDGQLLDAGGDSSHTLALSHSHTPAALLSLLWPGGVHSKPPEGTAPKATRMARTSTFTTLYIHPSLPNFSPTC